MFIPAVRLKYLRGEHDIVYIHFDDDVIRAYKMKMTIKEYAKRFYNTRIDKIMMSNRSREFRKFFKDESVLYVFSRLGVDYAIYQSFSWKEIAKQTSRFIMFNDITTLSNFNKEIRVRAVKVARVLGRRRVAEKELSRIANVHDLALEVARESVEDVRRQLERKTRADYSFCLIPYVERLLGYEHHLIRELVSLFDAYGEERIVAVDDGVKVDEDVKVLTFSRVGILSATSLI